MEKLIGKKVYGAVISFRNDSLVVYHEKIIKETTKMIYFDQSHKGLGYVKQLKKDSNLISFTKEDAVNKFIVVQTNILKKWLNQIAIKQKAIKKANKVLKVLQHG